MNNVFGEKRISSVEACGFLWWLFDGEGRTIEEKDGGGGGVTCFEIKKNIKFVLRWKQKKKNKQKKCCGKEAIYEEQKIIKKG